MTIGVLSWVWNPLLKSGLLGSNYDQLHPEWWQYWSNAVYYFCRASLHLEPKNLNRNARFFFGLPRYRSCSGCWNPTWRVVEHKLLKMPIFQALTQDLLKATSEWCELGWERLEELMPGGATTHIFFWKFHPEIWGNDPIWRTYVLNGLVQPPTRIFSTDVTESGEQSLVITVSESNDVFRLPFQFKSLLNQGVF